MNFGEQLVDSSKIIGDIVAEKVGCNPEYYREILKMVLFEPMPMSSRAGRVLNICTEKSPQLFQPHIHDVITHLKKGNELHRSILKILAEIPVKLNSNQEGILVNACFDLLADESQTVAVKIYSMEILGQFAQKEPAIIPELVSLLEEQLPFGTPGVRYRAAKIIKKLSK